jgi:hypothetical protein
MAKQSTNIISGVILVNHLMLLNTSRTAGLNQNMLMYHSILNIALPLYIIYSEMR